MNYVDELRQEGQLESVGAFTIDLLRSRAILYCNCFPEPAMYVLKLIQALVVAHPSSVEITSSARRLELVARGADPSIYSRERLERGLADGPAELPDDGLRDLVLGLGSALGLGHTVEVQQRGPQGWSLFERPEDGDGLLVRIGLKAAPRRELELIKERCRCCPVPLTLNGKTLLGHPWSYSQRLIERIVVKGATGLSLRPQIAAEVADVKARPWFYFTVPLYLRELVTDGTSTLVPGGWSEAAVSCSGATSLSTDLRGQGWLRLVKHGVLLDPSPLQLSYGCEVLLSGDGLATDASGFKARDGDALNKAQATSTHMIGQAAGSVRQQLKRIDRLTRERTGPTDLPNRVRNFARYLAIAMLVVAIPVALLAVAFTLSTALLMSVIVVIFVAPILFPFSGFLILGSIRMLNQPGKDQEYRESLHWKLDRLFDRLHELEQQTGEATA